MDTKGLQKEFISWCKSKNKSPKTKEETQQLFVSFMKEKHPEEYKKAVESQLQQQAQQAQKALHGAKLQYFRKLKNQCAEDEEVVYYKKGGSVNCGCKKKEDGGEVRKAGLGCSAIDKFKKMKSGKKITIKQQPQVNPSDTVHVNGIAYSVTNSDGSPVDNRFKPYSGKVEEEDRKKAKKGDKDALKRQLKQDLASSEKCGGKVKKHKQGGSLNGIPFYLGGTPKGGIEFKENLEPPTYGVLGELGRNLEQGSEQFGKIIGSPTTLILLTGLGSGVAGMVGPTVRILKDARTALGSKSGFRNAIRKISRNLNAKKGSPEFKWIKTSGDIKKGGAIDRSFNGMGKSAQKVVNNASRSEGSGYNAQQILNNNPIYLLARSNPESLGWKPYHTPANNLAYTTSNRVFERNRLIDKARDWRNWIFE